MLSFLKTTFKRKPPLTEIVGSYIADLEKHGQEKTTTITNHKIKLKNLLQYQSFTKKTFTANSFDLVQAERFKDWFRETRQTPNITTANRNVTFFRQALQWAAEKGTIKAYGLAIFRPKKDKVKPPVILSAQEVDLMMRARFELSMLERVRDLYLFQISTGLSYGDIWSDFEIMESESGQVILGTRAKNGQAFYLPADDLALAIIEKYNGRLPVYCNQVYNRVIKQIAAILGIEKKLKTHTARKTFATLKDECGWSKESISLMLGHKSVKTTETYYIAHSFKRVQNEMLSRKSQKAS